MNESQNLTAFVKNEIIASGDLQSVLIKVKQHVDRHGQDRLLIFDDQTGKQVDFVLKGTIEEVLAAAIPQKKTGPGRPRLGVISREVSLLPRHWEWLEQQRHGISGTLRRLIDEARKREPDLERERQGRDAAGKFMWAIAGDFQNFEEATRALFAGDNQRLQELINDWPADIQTYIRRLAAL